jgi:hypothetical protein
MACELLLFYHLGLLLILAGVIVAQRHGERAWPRIAIVVVFSLILAGIQFIELQHTAGESARKTLGMMTGLPSVWSYVRGFGYSPFAWLIVGLGLLRALWLVAQKRPVPDYWLFFILTVWLPLFALGFFGWYVDARYTEFALLPLLLSALALSQDLITAWAPRAAAVPTRLLAAAAVGILVINPISVAHTVNAGYTIHPDHKGAADYIRSIHPGAHDLIVAEDALQQTYYLGHIDYWLRGINDAAEYVQLKGAVLRDIYTDTPLIGTGAELTALIERRDRGAIYVIGTGEFKGEGLQYIRSHGIAAVLQQPIFEPVYLGRDGLTQVWMVRAPDDAVAAPAASR